MKKMDQTMKNVKTLILSVKINTERKKIEVKMRMSAMNSRMKRSMVLKLMVSKQSC